LPLAFNNPLFLRVVSALILMPFVLAALVMGGVLFYLMVALALIISVAEWGRMARLATSPALNGFVGIIYIVFCMACFAYMRLYDPQGAGIALCLILSIWASDSGAYFSGKTIGGPKMAPAISPNKTWAGLVGGVAASTALVVLYALYIGPWISRYGIDLTFPAASLPQLVAFGVLATLSGQAGDLLISKEKRLVGVKDTGNLIPGHGGLLDRIDSLLLASVVFLVLLKAFGL